MTFPLAPEPVDTESEPVLDDPPGRRRSRWIWVVAGAIGLYFAAVAYVGVYSFAPRVRMRACVLQAQRYLSQGDVAGAREEMVHAESVGKLDERARVTWVNVAHAVGDYPKAIEVLDLILADDPKDGWALAARGLSHCEVEAFAKAERDLVAALEAGWGESNTYWNLGFARISLGKWRECLEPLEQAIELDPENLDLRRNRVTALIHVGEYGPAAEEIERALATEPESAKWLHEKGGLLLRTGRVTQAVEIIERSLAIWPDNPHAVHNLAYARELEGDLGAARALYGEALRLRPDLEIAANALRRLDSGVDQEED